MSRIPLVSAFSWVFLVLTPVLSGVVQAGADRITFVDRVRSVEEQQGKAFYRITFREHAAIYRLEKKTAGSGRMHQELKRSLETGGAIQIQVDPTELVITGASEK